jgi:hypothetical protein
VLREIIWLIIAVLFGYVVFQIYRVLRLAARNADDRRTAAAARPADDARAASSQVAPPPASPLARDDGAVQDGDGDTDVLVFDARPHPPSSPRASPAAPAPRSAAAPAGDEFQPTLALQQLRRELAQLRAELAAQREQFDAVRADLRTMQEQLDAALASQGVSPEYNEALVFARRGLDAEAISERCGISMAEAELVRSLAQGGGGAEGPR